MTERTHEVDRPDGSVASLVNARRRLLAVAEALPARARRRRFLGSWCVMDLLAHLVGWDETNRRAIHEIRAGRLPSFYRRHDPDWATYNAALVRRFGRGRYRELRRDLDASHGRLLRALARVPQGDLRRDFGVRSPRGHRVTIASLLTFETRDEQRHRQQLARFAARRTAR